MHSLLFEYMEELLFRFHTEGFLCRRVAVSLDESKWTMRVRCFGCQFDPAVHVQGTEVKAITYSNMQIHRPEGARCDIYVIVDI